MTDTIAATEGGHVGSAGGSEIRLGRVERAILAALPRDGGFVSRDAVVRSAFPDAQPHQAAMSRRDDVVAQPLSEPRALAEAAVSRAIGSLQRKGLVVRDRNRDTGRTLLRSSAVADDPAWELVARAEEDFSAHAAQMARRWRSLSLRARHRAGRVRRDRTPEGTEDERRVDMTLATHNDARVSAELMRAWAGGDPLVGNGSPRQSGSAGRSSAKSSIAPRPTSLRSGSGWQWWRALRTRIRDGATSDAREVTRDAGSEHAGGRATI